MSRMSIGRVLVGAFAGLAIASIIAGFSIIGSPSTQRSIGLDNERVKHLRQIATQIEFHWRQKGVLPNSLSEMSNEWVHDVRDPESGEPYAYQVTGERAYKLCAVFALKDDKPAERPWQSRFSRHEKGKHCFDAKVECKKCK